MRNGKSRLSERPILNLHRHLNPPAKSPRCRKAAQRTRDRGTPINVAVTRPSVAPDAVLSVTTPEGLKPQGVTLRQPRKPPTLNPRIVSDPMECIGSSGATAVSLTW